MPAAKRKPKPRKREAKTKRRPRSLLTTVATAVHDLQKRVERLERKDRRRLIGFHAEGIPVEEPDLDEIAETEIVG